MDTRVGRIIPPLVIIEVLTTDGKVYERKTPPENAGVFEYEYGLWS